MKLEANLITATSKKTGSVYTALDIELTPGYVKRVFLTTAELALVKMNTNNKQ